MSSLLDILNRKDGRADPEPTDEEPVAEGDAAGSTVELRLAVDNRLSGNDDVASPAAEELSIAPEPVTAAEPPGNPFATFVGSLADPPRAGDATRVLTAADLRQRSRRSTFALGAGLGLILVAAGAATWLLDEVRVDTAGDSALFVTPGPDSTWTPPANTGIVDRPAPGEAAPDDTAGVQAAAPVQAPTAAAADDGLADSSWFDTPASERPASERPASARPASERPASEEPAVSAGGPATIRIVRGTTTNPLFPKLTDAWSAFQTGDYARAEALYREVSAADSSNIDALLGLAALAARGERSDEARDLYQAALLVDPRNATAVSALSTLPAMGARVLDESALKTLLREQPGAANLHFALGLQYVTQGRWPDAQTAFFEAVRNEPGNADYAYNLAVSLDQLGQKGPAAAYYRRALDLATASALFNPGVAEARVAALRSAAP